MKYLSLAEIASKQENTANCRPERYVPPIDAKKVGVGGMVATGCDGNSYVVVYSNRKLTWRRLKKNIRPTIKLNKKSTKKSTKKSAKKPTKKPTKNSAKKPTKKSAKKPTQKLAQNSLENSAKVKQLKSALDSLHLNSTGTKQELLDRIKFLPRNKIAFLLDLYGISQNDRGFKSKTKEKLLHELYAVWLYEQY